MTSSHTLAHELTLGHGYGWQFTPLSGKRPKLKAWSKRPPPTLDEVTRWAASGNVGLRTGKISGVSVVDLDEGCPRGFVSFPRTATVKTRGGWHLYYKHPEGRTIRNSVGEIDEALDIRGDGGQVVFPGSVHPDTGDVYQWSEGLRPEDVGLAPFPEDLYDEAIEARNARVIEMHEAGESQTGIAAAMGVSRALIQKILKKSRPPAPVVTGADPPAAAVADSQLAKLYVKRAVNAEVDAVADAGEGTRNHTLNTAAFNLGQLVGGGYLSDAEVVAALTSAAGAAGLNAHETAATIKSGLDSGRAKPRVVRTRPEPQKPATNTVVTVEPKPDDATGRGAGEGETFILAPGNHVFPDWTKRHVTMGETDDAAISSINGPELCRRDMLPGELVERDEGEEHRGKRFVAITPDRVRRLVAGAARLRKWSIAKSGDLKGEPVASEVEVSPTMARSVLDALGRDSSVRTLRTVIRHPAYGPDFERLAPGWNPSGVYLDTSPDLASLTHEHDIDTASTTLRDLVIDFPFRDDADRDNFIGLLLTPMIRGAFSGPVPMHLIQAPLERTGKTLLAKTVVGGVLFGRDLPQRVLPERDDELEKRVLAMLMRDDTVWLFDNINHYVDSATLAALLTSNEFYGRVLGQTLAVELPADQVIIATGNNVRASAEIVKRTVPIRLQPADASPESRNDFQHPDLSGFVHRNRARILSCLLGMVENWKTQGSPRHRSRLGGFDDWSEVVGGILQSAGFGEWRSNVKAWREDSDTSSEEVETFVKLWWDTHYKNPINTNQAVVIAENAQVFDYLLAKPNAHARSSAIGWQLRKLIDRPVGNWIVRRVKSGGGRNAYQLEQL